MGAILQLVAGLGDGGLIPFPGARAARRTGLLHRLFARTWLALKRFHARKRDGLDQLPVEHWFWR
jgi:hypothetical protein